MNIDDFMEEDEWEDSRTVEEVKAKYPDHWSLVKIINFTEHTLLDVKNWCEDNCTDQYSQVGWGSECSYTVGVIFEGLTDAVTFRLIWGSK